MCFTSITVIGEKLYSNNPKNMNLANKYSKKLVSVLINLGGYILGGCTVFYDGVKQTDLGKRAQVLNHLYMAE